MNTATQIDYQAEFDAKVAAGTYVLGSVTIARGGKLHPALMDYSDPVRFPNGTLRINCSCTGTAQGRAYNRARWYKGVAPTCKR